MPSEMAAREHHEIFLRATGGFEGEKRCMRKMIGAKTSKFGQQYKVRTVGIAKAPILKSLASEIFDGYQPSVVTNINKSYCCV